MTSHPYEPGTFHPTDLQPFYDGINFSPLNSLLNQSADRVRKKTREISKHGADHHVATLKEVRRPLDREINEFATRVAESLVTGTDVLNPFSAETRTWMVQNMGVSAEWAVSWSTIVHGLLLGGEQELELCDFILWNNRLAEVQRSLRRMQAALAIESRVPDIIKKTATSIQNYVERRSGNAKARVVEPVEAALNVFLAQTLRLLRFGSDPEIQLNICRMWAEQLAPQLDLGVPGWQFFIATLDMHLREVTGPVLHRCLTPFFETLHHAAPRFSFCGVLYRHLVELETVIDPMAAHLPFKWQELLEEIVGEIVCAGAPSHGASPIAARLLQGVDVLRGASPQEFREFSLNLINACRPLCERNWLDWLDASMEEIHGALLHVQEKKEAEGVLRKVVETTCQNLREGRDVFAAHQQLLQDIEATLDAAFQCSVLYPDVSHAGRRFRAWFVEVLLARRPVELWRHTQTLVRAIGTYARQESETNAFLKKNLRAIEMLSELLTVAPTLEWLLSAWSAVGQLPVDASTPAMQKEMQWALRMSALEYVRSGQLRAAKEIACWTLHEVIPVASDLNEGQFELRYLGLYAQITRTLPETSPLRETGFTAVLNGLGRWLPSLVASHKLWLHCEGLGNEIARRVHSELTEYTAKTGISGAASCARDNALTLRRVALALEPTSENPREDLADWWGNLVNAYVVNRPGGLFHANCEAMLAVCREQLTQEQSALVESLVRPLYEGASTDDPSAPVKLPPFVRLPWGLGWEKDVSALASFGWADEAQEASEFFAMSCSHALKYTERTRHPSLGVVRTQAVRLIPRLADGFPRWRWSGSLDQPTVNAWCEFLEASDRLYTPAEALLHGWMQCTDTVRDPQRALAYTAYLQELLEFNRQCAAGLALRRDSASLGKNIALSIHERSPKMVGEHVSAPNPERCGRDLAIILKVLGEGMSQLPRAGARLHIERSLSEQIAPHVGYGESVWRMVWMIAAELSEALFDPSLLPEIEAWFQSLETVGPKLQTLGAINRRLLLGEEPQFSSDPQEEWEWRKTISAILVVHQFHGQDGADTRVLRGSLCATLSLMKDEEFGDRLEAIAEAFKVWFVDMDVNDVVDGLLDFRAFWISYQKLSALLPDLGEINDRMASRLGFLASAKSQITNFGPQLNRFAFQTAVAARQGSWTLDANRWGVPTALRVLDGPLGLLLGKMERDSVISLGTAFSNVFSAAGVNTAQMHTAVASAAEILRRTPTLHRIWVEKWGTKTTTSLQPESCERDLGWLARRLAVDAAANQEPLGANSSGKWYLQEVLPYAGNIAASEYLRCFDSLTDEVISKGYDAETAATFAQFSAVAPGILAGHVLSLRTQEIAELAISNSWKRHAEYFTQLSTAKQASCRRDATLTLNAAARASTGIPPALPVRVWFAAIIRPLLTPREDSILPTFRGALSEAVFASLEPALATVVDATLTDLATDRDIWLKAKAQTNLHVGGDIEIAGFFEQAGPAAVNYAAGVTQARPIRAMAIIPVLIRHWDAFLWSSELPDEVCATWRTLLTAAPDDTAYSRFISGLMQQTEIGVKPLVAIKVMSYLQELMDFHRQCIAGLALVGIAGELANAVSEEITRAVPAEIQAAGALAHPTHMSQVLNTAFELMGHAMASSRRSVALLRSAQMLTEYVAPKVSYDGRLWRMIWMIASQESESRMSPEVWSELTAWFDLWKPNGAHMANAGTIMNRVVLAPETRYHPDNTQDWALRRSVTLGLSIALIASENVAIPDSPECTETSWATTKADTLDVDTIAFDSAFAQMSVFRSRRKRLLSLLTSFRTWRTNLNQRIPLAKALSDTAGVGADRLLAHLLACSILEIESHNSWALPSAVHFATPEILALISASPEVEVRRLANALSQLAGLTPEEQHRLDRSCTVLARLGRDLASVEYAWSSHWTITLPAKKSFLGFGAKKNAASASEHASCARDLKWTARRIAVEGWVAAGTGIPNVTDKGAARWFVREVMSVAPHVQIEEWLTAIAALGKMMQATAALSAAQKQAATTFVDKSARMVAGHLLQTNSKEMATLVTTAFFKRAGKFGELIGGKGKDSCVRDTRLLLARMARMLQSDSGESAGVWWSETIGRHLKGHTHDIMVDYFEAMRKALAKELPETLFAVVETVIGQFARSCTRN